MTDVSITNDTASDHAESHDGTGETVEPTDGGAAGDDSTESTDRRSVFISHKHTDSELAGALVDFVRHLSSGNVDVHASSTVAPNGAKFGELTTVIKDALAASGVVILLYTDPADNWEFCLWECGVATDPTDLTPTRVEVLSIGGAVPSPYAARLRVSVSLEDREADTTSLVNFARAFTRDDSFWLDGRGALVPNMADETIDLFVQQFLDSAAEHVRQPEADRQRVGELMTNLNAEAAAKVLPAVELMCEAATWGFGTGPHAQVFNELWNRSYVDDLAKLANQSLVFRPPSTVQYWERLLRSAVDLDHAPGADDEPLIRLVSGEERDDPLEFWVGAVRNENADARSYENPLRDVAKQLRENHGHDCVERRFLLPESFFAEDEERIGRFEEITEAMGTAGITVSLARLSDALDDRWRDFAVVGSIAVSRFASIKSVRNRVLEEDFRPQEVQRAVNTWNGSLDARWSSRSGEPVRTYLERRNCRI